MKVKKVAALVSVLLGGLFSAQASFAADTVCTVVYWSGGNLITEELDASNQAYILEYYPPVSTIAVASNFYAPAIDLIKKFTTAAGDDVYSSLGVCHNATGHLADEIKGNNPAVINGEWLSAAISYKYSLFLAADANTPYALFAALDSGGNQLYTLGKVKLYASGIPALLANPNSIQNETDLVSYNASGPLGFYGNGGSTGPVVMNTSAISYVAIGNQVNAPYGAAGAAIIRAMGQWSDPASRPGNSPTAQCPNSVTGPTGTPSICEYDNINVTFSETIRDGSELDAGWVSLAQIISAKAAGTIVDPAFVYFPSYAIAQTGVKLKNPRPDFSELPDGSEDDAASVAADLWAFIDLTHPDSTTSGFYLATPVPPNPQTWNDWLEDNGYGRLPDPN